MLIPLVLLAQLGTPRLAPSSVEHAVDVAQADIGRFVERWRVEWMDAQMSGRIVQAPRRRPTSPTFTQPPSQVGAGRDGRAQAVPPPSPFTALSPRAAVQRDRVGVTLCATGRDTLAYRVNAQGQIQSQHADAAVCPAWYPDVAPDVVGDERVDADALFSSGPRARMRTARARLIARLDSLVAAHPSSDFLVGQQVRFLLDQADTAAARVAARACAGTPAWCLALEGTVAHRTGDSFAADSLFLAALAARPLEERCVEEGIEELLDTAGRRAYAERSCDARSHAHATLWWLADPLWIEPGNERRAEHFARRTLVRLRAAPRTDDRFWWAPAYGGDALAEMVIRFGWPAHFHWAGFFADRAIDRWYVTRSVPPHPPYTGPEYHLEDRMHVVPSWEQLQSPWHWSDDTTPLVQGERLSRNWWPHEHFVRAAGKIVMLPEGQLAFLRRHGHTMLLSALDLDPETLGRSATDSVRSALFLSTGPAEVAHLSDATVVADGRLVHVTPARGGLALVGVEIASEVARDSTRLPAARRRIGLFVPRPLGALQPGARALSEPVLFAPAATGPSVTDDHALVARMLGTTTLRRTPAGARRVGIYWESYGFAQSDTVDVALQISREDEANVLRRITTAVGVTDDVSGTRIETRWREPSGTRAALVGDEGPVTILMRSLVLDLGALARGRYRVEIEMRQPGGEAIRTGRSFSIE